MTCEVFMSCFTDNRSLQRLGNLNKKVKYYANSNRYLEVILNNVNSVIIVKVCLVNTVDYLLIDAWILTYIVCNMILKYTQQDALDS